ARPWLQGRETAIDAVAAMPLDLLPIQRVVALTGSGVYVRLELRAAAESKRLMKLQLVLENHEPWQPEFASNRDAMLERSLVGVHLLLGVDGGSFISLFDPPEYAAASIASCRNCHTWPVLVGDRGQQSLMLSSPIVLYDYPSVATESPGELCDATEIDEILS